MSTTAGSVNIAKAGTYTITVKVGEEQRPDLLSSNLATRLAPEPEASNTLLLHVSHGDGNTLLAVMSKD